MKSITWKNILVFFGIYLIVLGVQLGSSYFTMQGLESWYPLLEKPPWNPPSWVFAPVWFVFYLVIAFSVWIIYLSDGSPLNKMYCYVITVIQLAINFFWSYFFFTLQSPFWGLMDIFALIISIVLTIFFYARVSKNAAYMLVPYLVWVCFATSLNWAIYALN
jgi:translocator protein